VGMSRRRRGVRGFDITSLPYEARVYLNNQVLVPAQLVRSLGIQGATYAKVVMKIGNREVVLDKVKLLRTKHTDSRQFTIPKSIRDKFEVKPGDKIQILSIEAIT